MDIDNQSNTNIGHFAPDVNKKIDISGDTGQGSHRKSHQTKI
jgi:hypothetical protein